ncbi:CARDB domain-containing protein [Blastopirellula marina]|uniref:CARDB domain-containing protein n=1 Tax=Blastopirellula marina TaxID=124 RepID=UPI001304B343|nr:CARDB domain-containing protein [Blastopirellula marina]
MSFIIVLVVLVALSNTGWFARQSDAKTPAPVAANVPDISESTAEPNDASSPPAEVAGPAAPQVAPPAAIDATDRSVATDAADLKGELNEATPIAPPATDKPAKKERAGILPAAEEKTAAAPVPPTITAQLVTAAGKPYSVGRLEVQFDGNSTVSRKRDETYVLRSSDAKIFYPTFQELHRNPEGKSTDPLSQLTIHFAYLEQAPTRFELHWGGNAPLSVVPEQVMENGPGYRELSQSWWQEFSRPSQTLRGELFDLDQDLKHVVATHVGKTLPEHASDSRSSTATSRLEEGFERVVRTLFGFDSVLLSMPDYRLTESNVPEGPANLPLPDPMRLNVVTPPPFLDGAPVEAIASYVPEDCYYVRCETVANYRWLRNLMVEWGGSLDEIVSTPTMDYEIRAKLERQLALDYELIQTEDWEANVSDLALIGTDLLFHDGPGIGILLEANDSQALREKILAQRAAAKGNAASAVEQDVLLGDVNAELLATPDGTIRSFYVNSGRYHLITNSGYVAQHFAKLPESNKSLADLAEFRYARSRVPLTSSGRVFMYLSDPFFRHVASPAYRVELNRRAKAVAELNRANAALLVSKGEGAPAFTLVKQLKQANYLPKNFAQRSDGGQPILSNGVFIDSLRGVPGTFVPVTDMPIDKITPREAMDYSQFTSRYRQEWRLADPVIVALDNRRAESPDEEVVSLKIAVTPYARQRYQFFSTYLGAVNEKAAPVPGDLLGISASLGGHGVRRQLRIGIQDEVVPHQYVDGDLVTGEPFAHSSLFDRNFYAAATPAGNSSLELMQRFAQEMNLVPKERPGNQVTMAILSWLIGRQRTQQAYEQLRNRYVENRGAWTVASWRLEIRRSVAPQLELQQEPDSAQILFGANDVHKSLAAPYLRAYTYLEARKASARNAMFLEGLTQQLGLTPLEAEEAAARILPGKLICPLGGSYQRTAGDENGVWASTAWDTPSYNDVAATPDDYQFAFLEWLHSMNVKFLLDRNTLLANIELVVARSETFDEDLPMVVTRKPILPSEEEIVEEANSRLPELPITSPTPDADMLDEELDVVEPKVELPKVETAKARTPVMTRGPDLAFTSIDAVMVEKNRLKSTFTITNHGDEPVGLNGSLTGARRGVSIKAFQSKDQQFNNADDQPLGEVSITNSRVLQPGESVTDAFTVMALDSIKSHPYLTVMVDYQKTVAESNEKNNYAAAEIKPFVESANDQVRTAAPALATNMLVSKANGPVQISEMKAVRDGDLVVISYQLSYSSEIGASGSQVTGIRQHWLERLGADPTIPAMRVIGLRDGRKYAAGGWRESLSPNETRTVEHRRMFDGYPPGSYRFTVRWKEDGVLKHEAHFDFELK